MDNQCLILHYDLTIYLSMYNYIYIYYIKLFKSVDRIEQLLKLPRLTSLVCLNHWFDLRTTDYIYNTIHGVDRTSQVSIYKFVFVVGVYQFEILSRMLVIYIYDSMIHNIYIYIYFRIEGVHVSHWW